VDTNYRALLSGSAASVNLSGSVSDPDGGSPGVTWPKVPGPGEVTFDDPSAVDTTASIGETGVYVLRLTAGDGVYQTANPPLPVTARLNVGY